MNDREDITRINGLSDGLFAIVLTLLVLELKVPEAKNAAEFGRELLGLLPQFGAYALTFAIAGRFWISHHQTLRHIERGDMGLLTHNLLFLFFVSLLPFTSALLVRESDPQVFGESNFRWVWIIYALNMVAIGLSLVMLWRYAVGRRLTGPEVTAGASRYFTVRGLTTPVIFLISALVALWNVSAGQLSMMLFLAYPVVMRRFVRPEAM